MLVHDAGISDVVMASHGRSGLSRVLLGSVADSLIEALDIPIVVAPALATNRLPVYVSSVQRVKIRSSPDVASAGAPAH